MEDDLIIFKVKYVSNNWSNVSQNLNLGLGDQTKLENCSKWRWHQMEDDLNILKLEYLGNHWSSLTEILSWGSQTKDNVQNE
jgi:hypothetical protein